MEYQNVTQGKHSIGSRVVLRNKYYADGSVERIKARVVTQGFSQHPGIDFTETFVPVAKLSSVRILLSIAAAKRLKVRQLDITTAYLNGNMDEEVYMRPPPRLRDHLISIVNSNTQKGKVIRDAQAMIDKIDKHNGEVVCKLNKAIYGLKQAGRQWHKKFDKKLRAIGLSPILSDPCVYTGKSVKLLIYVDDILGIYNDEQIMREVFHKLQKDFEVKDLGKTHYLLGIEIKITETKITLSQGSYIQELVRRFHMEDANTSATPIKVGIKFTKASKDSSDNSFAAPYRELLDA